MMLTFQSFLECSPRYKSILISSLAKLLKAQMSVSDGQLDYALKAIDGSDRTTFLLLGNGCGGEPRICGVLVLKSYISTELGEIGLLNSIEIKTLFVPSQYKNHGLVGLLARKAVLEARLVPRARTIHLKLDKTAADQCDLIGLMLESHGFEKFESSIYEKYQNQIIFHKCLVSETLTRYQILKEISTPRIKLPSRSSKRNMPQSENNIRNRRRLFDESEIVEGKQSATFNPPTNPGIVYVTIQTTNESFNNNSRTFETISPSSLQKRMVPTLFNSDHVCQVREMRRDDLLPLCHQLSVGSLCFRALVDELKTIESRVQTEMMNRIEVGDLVLFTMPDSVENSCLMRVDYIKKYSTFLGFYWDYCSHSGRGTSIRQGLKMCSCNEGLDPEGKSGVILLSLTLLRGQELKAIQTQRMKEKSLRIV